MSQLTDVILLWPGTHASIPTGWTRETTLDDKFAKAWGNSVEPNNTGGAAAHSHTGESHSHARSDTHGHLVAYNAVSNSSNYGGSPNQDAIAQANHGHASSTITTSTDGAATSTIAYPTSTNNNRPPYHELIYIKGGSGAAIASDIIALSNSSSIPAGWRACTDGSNGAPALGNKYPRGATTGANAGTTDGSLTHTHVLNHSHTTSHTHTGTSGTDDNHPTRENGSGSGGNKTGSHQHNVTLNAASVTTDTYTATLTSGDVEPAYKKLLAIQSTGGGIKKGAIAMYLGSSASLPKGWMLCNGQAWEDASENTPDMRDKFLKFANATGEIGNTGGANSHAHAASNSHTHSESAVHSHTGSTDNQGGSTANGGSTSTSSHSHSLASVGNNNATMTWAASTMSAESVDNQPEYRTLAFIQLTKPAASGAGLILFNMMT